MTLQFKPLTGMVLKEDKEKGIKITEASFSNAITFLNRYSLILSWKDPSRVKFTTGAYEAIHYKEAYDFKSQSVNKMFQYMAEFPSDELHKAISQQSELPLPIVQILPIKFYPDIAAWNKNEDVLTHLYSLNKRGINFNLATNTCTPAQLLTSDQLNNYFDIALKVVSNSSTPQYFLRKQVSHETHEIHIRAAAAVEFDGSLIVNRLNQCATACSTSLLSDSMYDIFNKLIKQLILSGQVKLVEKEQ